ncbi:hypothetical protein ZOSMA_134G00180 [Zostera marina]|uniref:Uncharacterized protein n=1 Tax=Zostera marina TaxID=29655 RepID=A0A0K9Q0Y3_ZOSMR|nr:hypothetical protein ZOSMA_134G00180 [Zostera marina]
MDDFLLLSIPCWEKFPTGAAGTLGRRTVGEWEEYGRCF